MPQGELGIRLSPLGSSMGKPASGAWRHCSLPVDFVAMAQ